MCCLHQFLCWQQPHMSPLHIQCTEPRITPVPARRVTLDSVLVSNRRCATVNFKAGRRHECFNLQLTPQIQVCILSNTSWTAELADGKAKLVHLIRDVSRKIVSQPCISYMLWLECISPQHQQECCQTVQPYAVQAGMAVARSSALACTPRTHLLWGKQGFQRPVVLAPSLKIPMLLLLLLLVLYKCMEDCLLLRVKSGASLLPPCLSWLRCPRHPIQIAKQQLDRPLALWGILQLDSPVHGLHYRDV